MRTYLPRLCRKDVEFQTKYGLEYSAFLKRAGEDEKFIQSIEAKVSKVGEADLADWEFCHTGIEDWMKKLQDILLK